MKDSERYNNLDLFTPGISPENTHFLPPSIFTVPMVGLSVRELSIKRRLASKVCWVMCFFWCGYDFGLKRFLILNLFEWWFPVHKKTNWHVIGGKDLWNVLRVIFFVILIFRVWILKLFFFWDYVFISGYPRFEYIVIIVWIFIIVLRT